MAFFEKFELADRISYQDFNEISSDLEDGEFLKFTLYDSDEPFYQGTFEKETTNQTVTDDIFSVLESYQKQKKISRKQKKKFQKKIKQAIKPGSETNSIDEEGAPDSQEPKRKKNQKQSIPILYKTIILFIGGITLLSTAIALYSFFEKSPSIQVSGESYKQLLSNKQYILAAEKYPNKKDATADYLMEEVIQSKEPIYQLKNYYQTVSSRYKVLDIFLLNEDYSSAIAEYEKEGFSLDQKDLMRGTLLGRAYLKIDQVEKAEKISGKINSPELEKYIARYKQYQLQIQELSKEIETLEKDPLENKDKIFDKIDALYDTKLEMKKM